MLKNLLQNRYLSYWAVLFIDLAITCISALVSIVAVYYFGEEAHLSLGTGVWMMLVALVVNVLCFYIFRT